MQTEIRAAIPLLDQNGHLIKPGWARQPFWQYDRSTVSAPWFRIKEWDYYYVLSETLQVGVAVTISDLGYAGLCAICWIDLKTAKTYQAEVLIPFPRGKLGLDSDSVSSKVLIDKQEFMIDYQVKNGVRQLLFSAPNLEIGNAQGLIGKLDIRSVETEDSINIATSWKNKPKSFYYNRKINCMQAEGWVRVGDQNHEFTSENCQAGLDWGRGNWTYKNRWFWASANGRVDGKPLGMNLGYGFSDRSMASENIIFYEGVAHKLEGITFQFDESDFMAPWEAQSSDGRLQFTFTPIVDRFSESNLVIIRTRQHQVFGRFDGSVVLDSGETIRFENMLGFAEDVFNCF